jgi:toxin secretion/phage lysis holin
MMTKIRDCSDGQSPFLCKAKKGEYKMKEFWNVMQAEIVMLGGWIGFFIGGCDGLAYALALLAVIDYLTGIMCAALDHKLCSAIGFRGICRKVLMFMLVGVANVLDVQIIGTGCMLRTAVLFFYISNEGISILENSAQIGLPIPKKMSEALQKARKQADEEEK